MTSCHVGEMPIIHHCHNGNEHVWGSKGGKGVEEKLGHRFVLQLLINTVHITAGNKSRMVSAEGEEGEAYIINFI